MIAYFGILPALLRLPLLAIPGGMAMDVTRLSIVLAAAFAAFWQIRAVWLLVESRAVPPVLAAVLGAALVLGGPQVQFLRATVYEEVLHWSTAFAAMFVCHALAGLIGRDFVRRLRWLALAVGLALLTRASTGAGLMVALAGLLAVLAWRGETLRRLAGAAGIAAAFVAVVMAVNFVRWGNPFTVVELSAHLMNARFPDRLARVAAGGEFSLARIPYGLMYYAAPVWPFYWPGGGLMFAGYQARMVEAELPPASFLLSDPLLLLLAARLRPRAAPVLAIAAGLALPALLMLGLVFMNHRYRHEFYPLLSFAAFAGLWLRPGRVPALRVWAILAVIGIGFAHLFLLFYLRAGMGPADATAVQMFLRNIGL
ncbi:MAG: hypothetical protein NT133_19170 [Alphaproteobacteria bacterium]|nr:hypothetical protein [Alphaproteobacteria bacterium]